jgi:Flp pilus assembly pilin Flp
LISLTLGIFRLQSGRQVEHRHMTAFIVRLTRTLRHRDEGQDLLEYALLIALIALGAVGAVSTVGETVKTVFWDAIAAAI